MVLKEEDGVKNVSNMLTINYYVRSWCPGKLGSQVKKGCEPQNQPFISRVLSDSIILSGPRPSRPEQRESEH